MPGSELTLTVQKGGKAGNVRLVKLQRIATERIADRRRMFELFTLIKARGSELQDAKIPSTVDKCISTWTNMLVADAYHQQKAIKRFKSLQDQCIRWLDQLCQDLPARGRDSHGMQKPSLGERPEVAASAHASPFDVGNVSLLLGQMHMELLGAADVLRKCIDEETLREISTGEICKRARHQPPCSRSTSHRAVQLIREYQHTHSEGCPRMCTLVCACRGTHTCASTLAHAHLRMHMHAPLASVVRTFTG